MCCSRKYPYPPPPHRKDWNFMGGGGFCKAKKFKEMYSVKLSWNFLGWGDLRKNSFCGRGMDISWNYIMFHANPIQKSH